MQAP
jgi:hypothetical protein